MRGLVKLLAFAALALWSIFAWAAYGLLGFAGGLAASSVHLVPLPPELVLWAVGLLDGAGGILVWIIWGLGAIAIVAGAMVALALLGRAGGRDRFRPIEDSPERVVPVRDPPDPPSAGGRRSGVDVVASVLGPRARH